MKSGSRFSKKAANPSYASALRIASDDMDRLDSLDEDLHTDWDPSGAP